MMNDEYDISREGMAYKDGAHGLGYYKHVPLLYLWEEKQGLS
jgi:hypothetical protein